MNLDPLALAGIAVAALAAVALLFILPAAVRTRKAARSRVNAECLVCPYLATCEDLRRARGAAGDHADATGHPLMLVQA